MADDKHYVPGTWYRICDRSGFKVRSYDTKKQWNDLIVRQQSWESRQPQDFVRGVRDDQTVSEARPRQIDIYIGPLQATVATDAPAGANNIDINVSTRMLPDDIVQIILDDGTTFRATIISIPVSGTIQFTPPLPYSASAGNVVVNATAVTVLDFT